jgi:hypothetical protein
VQAITSNNSRALESMKSSNHFILLITLIMGLASPLGQSGCWGKGVTLTGHARPLQRTRSNVFASITSHRFVFQWGIFSMVVLLLMRNPLPTLAKTSKWTRFGSIIPTYTRGAHKRSPVVEDGLIVFSIHTDVMPAKRCLLP